MDSKLFMLRIRTSQGLVTIHAFDDNHTDPSTGHMRIDVEIKLAGEVIFARGDTYCAVNRWTAIDSYSAKELVLSLASMKPGDTDAEYFAKYTPRQLEFANALGDEISLERARRYCDSETGSLRKKYR